MKTLVLLAIALPLASAASASDFKLASASRTRLSATALGKAEKAKIGASVTLNGRALAFPNKNASFVAWTGPESDMLSFRISGLRNPALNIKRGSTVRVLFVNTDGDMLHSFRITRKGLPFTSGVSNRESVGSGDLPSAKGKSFSAEQLTFKAPEQPGIYHYVCTTLGHAAAGMYGTIVVR